jgi:hypothetical protein
MNTVARALQAIALAGLLIAGAATNAMEAGTDTTAISSKPAQPADARLNLDALDLNVYGLAYHPDREKAHRKHMDNEVNPGLALHYRLVDDPQAITFAEAGTYEDSGRHWAKFAGLGYQIKFSERWRIGGALAAINSPSYNRGITFVGMIPLITYDVGPIKLNAAYFPKVWNNKIAAFGLYVGIPFGQGAR